MLLSPDILQQIRLLDLKTRRLVHSIFAGAYHSAFKGQGIAFEEVRPYEPGDDVRDIDWNVTARTGEPYIKRYVEERELTVLLMVDASASTLFGSMQRAKRELAAEMGAALAYAAIRNNDRVGLLAFSDKIELYLPPRKSRNHTLHIIRELLAHRPESKGTDIGLALRTANTILKRGAIIFLLSDFLAQPKSYTRPLMALAQRHDVIAVVLNDPREFRWPKIGMVRVEDAETGKQQVIDTSSTDWQTAYHQQQEQLRKGRQALFRRAAIDTLEVAVNGDYIQALSAFFHERERRR